MAQPRVNFGTDNDNLRDGLWSAIQIHQALNDHWTCRVVLRNTPDARPAIESQVGKPLRVSTISLLGVENILFDGLITRARLIYEISGAYGAELEAVSHTAKLDHGPRWRYFKKQSAQAVASAVVAAEGLTLTGSMPAGAELSYAQFEESSLAFVARLVDDVEAWFRPSINPDQPGLEVQTAFQSGPTLEWREGEYGLLEWENHGNVRPLSAGGTAYDPQPMLSQYYPKVESASSFTGGAARMVSASAAAGNAQPAVTVVRRERTATNAQFEQRLERESRRASASSVSCRGISREPQVRAGDIVTVVGLPEVSGSYGVIECTHNWTVKGYENAFVAVPATRWSPPVRPPASRAPGVYPARVLDNFDPHNQGRVQVAYFWQEAGQTAWVRLLSPYAGADRGVHFAPEKGDEVLVAFEEGDPERPYLLGSVWNGAHHPPAEGFWKPGEVNQSESESNQLKRLTTRSGHRITLSDTPGRETISLATPTGTRFVLAEQLTETGGRPGILMHSDGDIVLQADGRIHEQSMTGTREVGTPTLQPVNFILDTARDVLHPLFHSRENKIICQLICYCNLNPQISSTGQRLKQQCVSNRLKVADAALKGHSYLKAEVSYNVATQPPTLLPAPDPGPDDDTDRRPGYKRRRPDVVIVKDPSKPPTADNIDRVIEIKFPGDRPGRDQLKEYGLIAGRSKVKLINYKVIRL